MKASSFDLIDRLNLASQLARRLQKKPPLLHFANALKAYVKIITDVALALILLFTLAPIMAIIFFWVRSDGGPVFFAHRRIGKAGKPFSCYKFRTMAVAPEEILKHHLAQNLAARREWEETQKLSLDPRVTSAGRFLRAMSLDELPQLFNVVKLEMSLVGPRPIVESELVRYGSRVDYYLRFRPGITGLWQVSGRSNTSYNRRIALDQWYVKNWRLWRDFAILLKTVPVVVRRDGAR